MKFTGKDGELRIYDRFGSYLKVHFANMDFSGPMGRPKLEEILVLDRGIVNDYGHYINGTDQVIFDPLPLTFSCMLESKTAVDTESGIFRDIIYQALICRDALNLNSDNTWVNGWGGSTKGSTQNLSGTDNPKFVMPTNLILASGTAQAVGTTAANTFADNVNTWQDGYPRDMVVVFTSGAAEGKPFLVYDYDDVLALETYHLAPTVDLAAEGVVNGDTYALYDNNRTVDIQYKLTGEVNDIVWKFSEVYFPPEEITIAESEDSISLSASGGVYGTITRHSDWS